MIGWQPEAVRAEVKRPLEAGMPGGKFVLGMLARPHGIPDENIRAMLEADYEYGTLQE